MIKVVSTISSLRNNLFCFCLHRAAVTDDLISPKYEDEALNDESTDDGDDEDEESDDTVYECPGTYLGCPVPTFINTLVVQGQ